MLLTYKIPSFLISENVLPTCWQHVSMS